MPLNPIFNSLENFQIGDDEEISYQGSSAIDLTTVSNSKKLWYRELSWDLIAYALYMIGSVLYLAQAIGPYCKTSSGASIDIYNKFSNSTESIITYYYYGSLPPFYPRNIGGWEGVIGAVLNIIQSFLYIVGWKIQLDIDFENGEKSKDDYWWLDYNLFGNILYFILSNGYLITSIFALQGQNYYWYSRINLMIAFLFLIDSLFYIFALLDGSVSRISTSLKKRRLSSPKNKDNKINWNTIELHHLDWYLIGSLLFVVGSIIYIGAAIDDYQQDDYRYENSKLLYLLASIVFMIDAPCYLISGFQVRSSEYEVNLLDRKNIFYVEVAC